MSDRPGLLLRALRAVCHASFLPFGVRDRLVRAAQSPDNGRDRDFEADLRGMRYAGHLASYIDWSCISTAATSRRSPTCWQSSRRRCRRAGAPSGMSVLIAAITRC